MGGRGGRCAAALAWLGLVLALTVSAPQPAAAQSSTPRTVRVSFLPATSDGFAGGSVDVQYAFLACYGELHLALRLVPNSGRSNGVYRMGGKTYTPEGQPQIGVAKVRGRASRAGEFIANVANHSVGPDGGLGCFSGDLTQVGVVSRWLEPQPKKEQVEAFLNSLILDIDPLEAVRDTGLEGRLKAQDRERQAAAEAQQRAQQQAAEARRAAEAKRAQDAARPISRTPTGAGGGYAPQTAQPAPAPPRPLSDSERIARAIASDKVLADQRLQEQRRVYAQQQAAIAAQQQRQNEAIIAAAPAIIELGAGLEAMINGPWHRAKERDYRAAQQQLAGQCFLPHGGPSPRDGMIQFGVPITSRLTKADCGQRATSRFKAYYMALETAGRLTVTLTSGPALHSAKYNLRIRDNNGQVLFQVNGGDYGLLQKTWVQSVQLPAGEYVIQTSNYFEYDFHPFTLRVDFTDAQGRKSVAMQTPTPVAAAPPGAEPRAPPAKPAFATVAGFVAGSAGPTRPPAATPAVQVATQPLATRFVTGEDKARVAALQSKFAIGWTPSRVVEVNALGTLPAGAFNTKCNKLVTTAIEPTLLTYKAGKDGAYPGGVLRYAGEGSRCRPTAAGVIQYADGSQWIGGVTSVDAAPMLPVPDGLGEFRIAEGVTKLLTARATAGGWEAAEVLVEPPPTPTKPATIKRTAPAKKRKTR